MSRPSSVVAATCLCGSLSPEPVQCPDHKGIFKNGKRLISVGKIVGLLPQPPCNMCGAASYGEHERRSKDGKHCDVYEKIVNAQERGSQCDELFSKWVIGKLTDIPKKTRHDVYDEIGGTGLLQKLMRWFNKQKFTKVESQVVVGDDEVGGVLDLRFDGIVYELKSVYDVTSQHFIQCAGYSDLIDDNEFGVVLHVSERFPEPRLRMTNYEDLRDFRTLRAAYSVLVRRSGKD